LGGGAFVGLVIGGGGLRGLGSRSAGVVTEREVGFSIPRECPGRGKLGQGIPRGRKNVPRFHFSLGGAPGEGGGGMTNLKGGGEEKRFTGGKREIDAWLLRGDTPRPLERAQTGGAKKLIFPKGLVGEEGFWIATSNVFSWEMELGITEDSSK